jgi:hypothetical protein
MRFVVVGALALGIVVLGTLQTVATVGVRPQAGPAAWVWAVSPDLAKRIDRTAASNLPLPAALRVLLARAALRDGDLDTADAALARLPTDVERAELAALVLEERGDAAGAADAYLRAGDLSGLERRIDALIDSKQVLPYGGSGVSSS